MRDESAISRCRRAGADGPSVFVASCSVIPRRAPSFADIALPRQDVSFLLFSCAEIVSGFRFCCGEGRPGDGPSSSVEGSSRRRSKTNGLPEGREEKRRSTRRVTATFTDSWNLKKRTWGDTSDERRVTRVTRATGDGRRATRAMSDTSDERRERR